MSSTEVEMDLDLISSEDMISDVIECEEQDLEPILDYFEDQMGFDVKNSETRVDCISRDVNTSCELNINEFNSELIIDWINETLNTKDVNEILQFINNYENESKSQNETEQNGNGIPFRRRRGGKFLKPLEEAEELRKRLLAEKSGQPYEPNVQSLTRRVTRSQTRTERKRNGKQTKECSVVLQKMQIKKNCLDLKKDLKTFYGTFDDTNPGFRCLLCDFSVKNSFNRSLIENHIKRTHFEIEKRNSNLKSELIENLRKRVENIDYFRTNVRNSSQTSNKTRLKKSAEKNSQIKRLTDFLNKNLHNISAKNRVFNCGQLVVVVTRCPTGHSIGPKFRIGSQIEAKRKSNIHVI